MRELGAAARRWASRRWTKPIMTVQRSWSWPSGLSLRMSCWEFEGQTCLLSIHSGTRLELWGCTVATRSMLVHQHLVGACATPDCQQQVPALRRDASESAMLCPVCPHGQAPSPLEWMRCGGIGDCAPACTKPCTPCPVMAVPRHGRVQWRRTQTAPQSPLHLHPPSRHPPRLVVDHCRGW